MSISCDDAVTVPLVATVWLWVVPFVANAPLVASPARVSLHALGDGVTIWSLPSVCSVKKYGGTQKGK